ncbi:hypothetical protein SEVIR_5G108866v4 [Setaria viridis]
MAHGLASTDRPFLWVVRPDTRPLIPDGFLDAVAGRGMVVPWSPQERVLAHPATACFLTHCGWNSTLETVAAGVPVVAFPQWGDQCTDAKLLVDELGIGVRLRAPLRREAVDAAVAGPGGRRHARKGQVVERGGAGGRWVVGPPRADVRRRRHPASVTKASSWAYFKRLSVYHVFGPSNSCNHA